MALFKTIVFIAAALFFVMCGMFLERYNQARKDLLMYEMAAVTECADTGYEAMHKCIKEKTK